MTRLFTRSLIVLSLIVSARSAYSGTCTAVANGNWSAPSTWSCSGGPTTPGATDSADTAGFNVAVDVPTTVGTLTLNGGTLSGPATLTIATGMTWSGGTIMGPGELVISAPATLDITTAATKSLDGRTVTNNGVINGSGTGTVYLYNAATIANAATFNLGDGSWTHASGAPSTFNNTATGSFNANGTAPVEMAAIFNNDGSVAAPMGTLWLTLGGTSTGTFTIGSTATLRLSGSHTFQPSSTLNGGSVQFDGNITFLGTYSSPMGTTSVSGGMSTLSGPVSAISSLSATGGSLTINSTPASIGSITVSSGTLTLNGAGVATSGLTLSGGLFGGNAALTVNGTTTWSGGTLAGPGSLAIPATRTMDITGAANKDLDGRVVTNSGTVNSSGTGPVYLRNAASFTNSAVFNLGNGSWAYGNGSTSTFTNSAAFNATGSMPVEMAAIFNNSGTVSVSGGTLWLSNGGTSTGPFTVASGATLRLSGTHDLQSSSSISGAGGVRFDGNVILAGSYDVTGTTSVSAGSSSLNGTIAAINSLDATGGALTLGTSPSAVGAISVTGGTLLINGLAATAPSLVLSSGTLGGAANLTVDGPSAWSGGTLLGPGALIIPSGRTLDISGTGSRDLDGRVLQNNGTVNSSAGAVYLRNAATINNASSFFLAGTVYAYGAGAASTFTNTGTLTKSTTAVLEVAAVFNNTLPGAVNIGDGTLWLSNGGSSSGSFSVGTTALLRLSGTHTITGTISGGPVQFDGNIDVSGGYANPLTTSVTSGNSTISCSTVTDLRAVNATGGTLTVTNTPLPVGALTIAGGTLILNGGGGGTATPSLTLSGGTLGGAANIYLEGAGTWSGGMLQGPGVLYINAGQTLTISGTANKDLDGRTINNNGTINSGGTGPVYLRNSAVVNNSGTFNVSDVIYAYGVGGDSTFNNNGGTLSKTTAGSNAVDFLFNNSGTVSIAAGVLTFNREMGFGPTGWLSFPISSLTGYGRANFPGGTFTFDGNLAATPTGGYTPNTGDVFTVISYPAATGSFISKNLVYPGGHFNDTAGATSLTLTAANAPTVISVSPPSGPVTGGTAVTISGSGFVAGGSFGVSFGGVAAGSVTYVNDATITCTTPAHSAGPVAIVVTNNDGQTGTLPAGFTYAPQADLVVSQIDDPDPIGVSELAHYFITVTNAGPDPATGVVLSGSIPPGTTLSYHNPPCSVVGSAITCAIGNLAPSTSVSYVFYFQTSSTPTTITNSLSVAGAEFDPLPGNNTSSETTTSHSLLSFMVDSTADEVDALPGDGLCVSVPSNKCTLRAAVQESNAYAGTNTISLPAGVYTLSLAGVGEDAAATGDLDVRDKLVIEGSGAATTTINGGGIDRVFQLLPKPFGPGPSLAFGFLNLTDVSITGGNTPDDGGAILARGNLSLNRSVISGNTAANGGGIYTDTESSIVVTSSEIRNNIASSYGGGLWVGGTFGHTDAAITDSTVAGNSAQNGGGIHHIGGDPLAIVRSTISGNTATADGGGLKAGGAGTVTVQSCTISGNQAGSHGGGIYFYSTAMAVRNSTIAMNSATASAGGVYNNSFGTLAVSNSILVATALMGGNCAGNTITTEGYNLSSDASCSFAAAGDRNSTDPLLGPLQNNGGATSTHALQAGSPAIDTGAGCEPTDQRGSTRPRDGNGDGTPVCDNGAFELMSAFTTTSVSSTPNPSNPSETVTLTATVTPSAAQGTIEFRDGGSPIATAPLTAGVATATFAFATSGTHNVTAVYAGDANFQASTSPVLAHGVRAATALTLTSSPNPSAPGLNVTFTATISPPAATGSIDFMDGATTIGTAPLVGGTATFAGPLSSGSHTMTAKYAGDAQHAPAVSAPLTQTVITCPGSLPITASPYVCPNSAANAASTTAIAGATYSWSIVNGFITSGDGTPSIQFTAGASGNVQLGVAITGCPSTGTATVPVNADTTITAPARVCINSTGNTASVPAQGGATYAWTINGGTITSATNGNSITFTAGTQPWVNLGVTVTTACGSANGGYGIETNPPTAIHGPMLVCPNSSNTVDVTDVPGTTYLWSITGGTFTSGNTSNSVTYTAPASGQVQLTVQSTTAGCAGSNTNSMFVQVGPPVINSPDRVCTTGTYNANLPWAPGASFVWSVTNGTITGGGNSWDSWIDFTPGASGSVTINATLSGISGCGPYTISKTIPIDPPSSTVAITAPAVVCAGTGGYIATATSYPGATYNWSVGNGTITGGQGTSSITFTAGSNTMPFVNVDASVNLGCGWVNAHSSVPLNADTTITAPARVCINSTGNTASVPAQGGATYAWTINGGTIVGSTTGNSITFTAGTQPSVNLGVTVTTACGSANGGYGIETNPPTAIHGSSLVCPNSSNTADVTYVAGTIYSWSIVGGTFTSGTTSNSVTYTAPASGQVQLTVTSTDASCATATNTNTLTITAGQPVISAPDRVCATAGGPFGANVPWSPGATYLWTITNGTITSGGNSYDSWINFTPGASGSVTLNVTIGGISGCGPYTVSKSIPIDPPSLPVAITAPAVVCAGTGGHTATATSYPGATYNWNVGNGTITGGQGSESITFTAGSSTMPFVNLDVSVNLGCGWVNAHSSVPLNADTTITAPARVCINSTGNTASVPAQGGATYAWTIGGGTITSATNGNSITFTAGTQPWVNLGVTVTTACGSANGGYSIETNPPTTIHSPSLVCPNSSNTADVTYVAGTIYSWSIVGGTFTSGTTSNSVTYTAPASGQVQLTVTSTDASCATSTNTNTLTITAGQPVISAPDRLCATAPYPYGANVPWTPGATYVWTITNGTKTNGGGSYDSWIDFTPGTSGSVTLDVTIGGISGCGPYTVSKTIPIDPPSSPISIAAPAVVCAGSTGNTASATAMAGAAYNWNIFNGTITAGQGTSTITFTAGPANSGNVGLNVSVNLGCGWSNGSATVPINAITTITAPANVCINSTGNVASVPAQAGATYNWTVRDGTLTSGQGTDSIIFTAGSLPFVNLEVSVTTSCGTAQGYRGVETSPPVAFHGPNFVCANSTGNTLDVTNVAGTTYSWSITGGTITSGAGTNAITYSAGTTGPIQISLTSTNSCGTSTNTWNVTVGTPVIQAPNRVCTTATGPYGANVPWSPGATYLWSITNGTITGGGNSYDSWINFTPGPSGSITINVTISGISGCGPYSVSKTIPIDPPSMPVAITSPAVVCAGATGISATATAYPGAVYYWSVNNGTITSGQGTSAITFTAGTSGTVNLYVNVALGCGNPYANASVPINALTTITAPASVCINSSNNVASVPAQSGASYSWTIGGGTITAGQGTNSITFTAGTATWVNLNVTVTGSCGSANGGMSVPTSPTTAISSPGLVCPGSSNTASVPLESGTSYSWSVTGGTITSATDTNSITYSAGSTGPLQLTVTSTNSCGTNTRSFSPDVGAVVVYTVSRVCATQTNYNAGASWVSGASYSWSITGGTITTSPTNSWVNFNPDPAASSVSLTVTVGGLACGPLTATKTIPIDTATSIPAVTITGPAYVCSSGSGTASVPNIAGVAYNWNISNGTITGGQGTSAITFTAGTSGTVNFSVNVTSACAASQYANLQVGINSSTITAPSPVCINSTGNSASVTAPAGSTFNWSVTNGTLTSGQGTNTITFTAGTKPYVNLNVSVTNSCGTANRGLSVPTSPPTNISAPTLLCPGGSYTASTALDATASYSWSIVGGTITAGANTNSVTFTAGSATPVQLTLTSTNSCGTNSNTLSIDVGTMSISSSARICSTLTSGASLPSTPGATYSWSISGGTFTSGTTNRTVSFTPDAGSTGVTLTGTVSGISCGPLTVTKTIPVDPPSPPFAIIGPASACPNVAATASATLYGGTTYNWSINNGTIVSGQGTSTIQFNPGPFGNVDINVSAPLGCGWVNTSKSIPISTDTWVDLRAPAVVCASNGASVSVFNSYAGDTYVWSLTNGTIIGGQGTAGITLTAGTSGTMEVQVVRTSACGLSSVGYATIAINGVPSPSISSPGALCAGATATATANGPPGSTFTWSITNGVITTATDPATITFTAGTSGDVTLELTATTCSNTVTTRRVIAINPPPAPVISASPVCPNSKSNYARVSGFAAGSTFAWTITNGTIVSSATSSNIWFDAGTSGNVLLSVSVTSCGATASTSQAVPISAPPDIHLSGAGSVCPSSTGNIASIYGGSWPDQATISWSITNGTITAGGNSDTITYTAGTSGTVTVSATVTACNVSSTASLQVLIGGSFPASIGSTAAVCASSTNNVATIAYVGPGATYRWSIVNGAITSPADLPRIEYTAGATGSVALTAVVTMCSGTQTVTRSIPITFSAPPTINSYDGVCPSTNGNTASISPPPGSSVVWSISNGTITSATTGNGVTYTSGSAGNVTLTANVNSCGLATTTTRDIPIGGTPKSSITAYDASDPNQPRPNITTVKPGGLYVAQTGSYPYIGIVPAVYRWTITNGTLLDNPNDPVILFQAGTTGTTTLNVTVTTCGGTSSSTFSFPVLTAVATITAPSTICASTSGTATVPAQSGATYAWSVTNGTLTTGQGTNAITFTAGASGSVTLGVTVTASNGSSSSATAGVTIKPLPVPTITVGGTTTFCDGQSVLLTASSGGVAYQWFNGGSAILAANTQAYTATVSGDYYVSMTDATGCTGVSQSVAVTVTTAPAFSIIGPASVCPNAQVTLDAGLGFTSYRWSTGETTRTITFSATSSATYSVTATDINGCTATASHTLTVTQAPAGAITPSGPTTFCEGGSVILTASSGTTWQWFKDGQPFATTQAITATASGSYTVQITSADCVATAGPTTVVVNPLPGTAISTSGSTTFCSGGSVTLTAANAAQYQWLFEGQPIVGATSPSYTATASGNYSVQLTSAEGCSTVSVIMPVLARAVGTIPITGPTTACAGGSVTLDAGAGYSSYLWSTGETTQSITVTPAATTTYVVNVIDSGGCPATGARTVTVATPITPVVTTPPSVCASSTNNAASVVPIEGATAYLWTISGGIITGDPTSAAVAFTAGASGTISLTVTVTVGSCTGASTAIVPIAPPPAVAIAGPATTCPGSTITLDAGSGFASYNWSTGATTQTITVSPTASTTYSVTVQSASGCSASASHGVTVATGTAPVIASPANVCANSPGNMASVPATAGATYAWTITGGEITAGAGTGSITFTAGASGSVVLGVTVTSSSCGGSANKTIPIVALPVVTITGPTSVCSGGSVTLDAGPGFASYLWSTGATTQSITFTPAASATYAVTVISSSGCTTTTSAPLTVIPSPIAKITAPGSVLAGSTGNVASVPAGTAGTTYLWTITGGSITAGAGTDRITFAAGQSGSVTLNVEITGSGGCKATGKSVAVVAAAADLALTLSGSSNSVNVNGSLIYTVKVTNNGPSTASVVAVGLNARSGATIAEVSGVAWTCTVAGTTATCSMASAPVGALQPITLKVTAPATVGTISTSATVSAASADPLGSNNSASVTASVSPAACTTTPPKLTAPNDGAANLTPPITFTWDAVANATSYELWLGADNAAPSVLTTTTSTSVVASVSGKSATWYVAARLPGDCQTLYSAKRSFTIFQPPACPTAAPQLIAPVDKGTTTSPVTFTWTAVPDAIGYRVWTSSGDAPAEDVGSTDPTKLTLSAAVNPGTISWFVEALHSGCPSVPSLVNTFTVPKPDPCAGHAAATLKAPANGGTSTSSVDFTWNESAGATGYRVWAKIDDAAAAVLGVTSLVGDTALKSSIPSGHVEWYVETLFDGCPSIESQHWIFDIPKAVTCGVEVPRLSAPAEGATVSKPDVTFTWDAVQGATSYELWLSLAGGTPALLGTTNTPSLTHDVPAGALEWFVRASFEGCPQRESAKGHLTYTPPPACSTVRPALNTPANNATNVFSPVELTWREVAGATSYRVYMIRGGIVDLVATSTTGSAGNIALPPGRIDWYVEAVLGSGCSSTYATTSSFTVVPPPAACTTPGAPVIVAESTASSGSQYTIRWQGVAPRDTSALQESLSGSFSDAIVINTTGDSYSFLHTNTSTVPITYYYRVRAIPSCSSEDVLAGPFSTVAAVVILPDKPTTGQQLQGATAAGSAQTITYEIPLDASLAGLAFTATPNESWLTVTPSSGIVPVGGMSLKVTANTADLQVGTTLGGITITTRPVTGSSRAATTGTTTVTTTVSVNLVQPVLPTPKNAPPPDALIIPAVAHADGINSKFQSDVRLTNTSAQVMKYQVTFIPSGDEGIKSGKQTSIDVDPGKTVALDDVLGTWFSSGAFKSLIGTLEIRPLTQSTSSTSGVTSTGLRNILSFASSRTYSLGSTGTYGQYIPAIPFASFIGGAADASKAPVLSLQQIAQSASYRTNLGIVEGSGQPASVLVSIFGNNGQKLKDFTLNLAGGQHAQLNSFLAQQGVELADGRVEVKVTSSTGRVTAYASVLDNLTSDPMLVTPVTVNRAAAAARYVVPGVADLNNGLANWRTDMRLLNASTTPVEATLLFYSQTGAPARTATLTMQPNEVKQLDTVLASVFGVTNDGGALHITTATPTSLVATARTYNDTAKGTYGQFISAVTTDEAAALGTRPLQLLQVEESDRFRSNIGLAEVSGKTVKVQLSVVPPDSRVTPTVEVDLAPNQFRQLTSLIKQMGLGNTYNARVTVKVVGGEGKVAAYASVIDAITQDPTYVPAQ